MSKENIQRVDIREDTYLEMLDKVNKYDKQKEVLDKIKEKVRYYKKAEYGTYDSDEIIGDIDYILIMEEIE